MNNKVYDISGKKKIWFIISLALIAAIAVITVIKGVEIAIEFKGGTIISYSYEGDASIKDAQSEIEDLLKTPVVICQMIQTAFQFHSAMIPVFQ